MKKAIHSLILLQMIFGKISLSIGNYSWSGGGVADNESKCYCNASQIFTLLPEFIKVFAEDERTNWIYKGRPGERGADGPEGPPGLRGRPGIDGQKGEPGPKGELLYIPVPGKGDRGFPGRDGLKGSKGEAGAGVPFTTVLRHDASTKWSYYEVKGEKGESGKRGRRGLKGEPGEKAVSIQGEKGVKGEPAVIPDLELIRGPQGLRGPPGISRPGCCRNQDWKSKSSESSGPFLIPVPGPPGLSIQGEKGEKGEPGIPGEGPEVVIAPGANVFGTETEMRKVRSRPGTICFIEENERLFIRVKNGWKEFMLGSLRLDKPNPFEKYPIAYDNQFDPEHRHYLNDVEKPLEYKDRNKSEKYPKKFRDQQLSVN